MIRLLILSESIDMQLLVQQDATIQDIMIRTQA
jgi:hypothetical protein